jgi:hypothetical protein
MNPLKSLRTAALSIAMVTLAALAQATSPQRVARLGYLDGEVSLLEAGDTDWVQAPLNQPLITGDNLWTDQSAGAELQVEGAAIRVGERSNLSILNLDERITQMQLLQGALRLRVRTLGPEQSIEVDTPNLSLVLHRTGDYRIEVDPQDGATLVLVHSGMAEVFGESATYRVDNSQAYRFYGTGLSEYEKVSDYRLDELDRWARERERRLEYSVSARYVPAGVVGYEDLDANGRWVVDGNYGNVWLPSRVDVGWTPYREGRWTWVDPWGWTWIDNAPWGYAVSHYGRWANLGNTWAWVPGATYERVVYSPALVVFVGGDQGRTPPHRHGGMGNSAWFPLGPREVYRPQQALTRDGYVNQHVRGAVVVANQIPSERAPLAEARSRPPRDNHPVMTRNIPPALALSTLVAPAKFIRPAETPVGARILIIGGAEIRVPVPVPGGRTGLPRGERPPEVQKAATLPAAEVAAPARGEPPIGEAQKRDAQRSDAMKNEAAWVERLKEDAARMDAFNPPAARLDARNREDAGRASAQGESARAEAAKSYAAKIEEARANAAKAEAAKNSAAQAAAQTHDLQEQAARTAETSRHSAAIASAARAETAKAEAVKVEAANAARTEQGKQRGRDADAQRGNAQRPDKQLAPEEELLQRGKRK